MFPLLVTLLVATGQNAGSPPPAVPWGRLEALENQTGTFRAIVGTVPNNGKVSLPMDLPPVLRCYAANDPQRRSLPLGFDPRATSIQLQLPQGFADRPSAERVIVLETGSASGQRPDGRIIFSAADARIQGKTAQLETHPGNSRIGFWTDPADTVDWKFTATRPGMYDLDLTYSLAEGKDNTVEIQVANKPAQTRLSPTGSWYQYSTATLGKVYISRPGEEVITVRCTKLENVAVMNLKAVILRPTSEGKPIDQAADGSVLCHARDVTIHGVLVQYEPKPEKNTVGYWANAQDQVSWDFLLKSAGRFEIEVLQGCGAGAGGSEVELSIDDQTVRFVVEDTGHFQNFVARRIGVIQLKNPGRNALSVKPIHKAGVAVMDLRQVRLIPIAEESSCSNGQNQ
ncbi:MAG: DUF5077 domain-containing protein [Planctomycetales bacterium]